MIANDGLDDSKALKKAIDEASKFEGKVTLQLPAGRLILSDVLYLQRSHFVFRGTGTGANGTEIYCPRPLMYTKDPESLQELREYLIEFEIRFNNTCLIASSSPLIRIILLEISSFNLKLC